MERTLVIIKPDALQRGLMGRILARLEDRGLRFLALKMIQMDLPLAQRLYAVHEGQSFYPGLVQYMTSRPVAVMVLEGRDAVQVVRNTMGATNPAEAAPGTIRGDWALEVGRNLIHGSDSLESARREISLFFAEEELLTYVREPERWIFE